MKIQADKQKIEYKNIYRQINKRLDTKMQADVNYKLQNKISNVCTTDWRESKIQRKYKIGSISQDRENAKMWHCF